MAKIKGRIHTAKKKKVSIFKRINLILHRNIGKDGVQRNENKR